MHFCDIFTRQKTHPVEKLYPYYLKHRLVTTDSRNCPEGSIYFALKGDRFDGNEFAASALQQGSSLAVVDNPLLKGKPGCYWVPDVLSTLQELAAHHRRMLGLRVIGITGSNGKTTTKELMAAVLGTTYKLWFTQGNLNNHIGVPLTLLSIPADTELAVVEMGANHIGEIARLCEIAQPDYGLITNVGKAHLEGFGSFEGVKRAKAELYRYLERKGGKVFVNIDSKALSEMLGGYAFELGYGESERAMVHGFEALAAPFLSFSWRIKNMPVSYKAETRLTGLYNLENVLAAIAVGVYFDVPHDKINKALSSYLPSNNRSQVLETGRNKVVLDAYNANPTSMHAALDNFLAMDEDNKVLILGGMKELGSESLKEHQILVERLLKEEVPVCYFVGREFKDIVPAVKDWLWFENSERLNEYLKAKPLNDALVLVKGSRSNSLEAVIENL